MPVFLPRRKLPLLAEALGLSLLDFVVFAVLLELGLEPGSLLGVEEAVEGGRKGGGSSSTRGRADCSRVIVGGVYFGGGLEELLLVPDPDFFVVDGAVLDEPMRLVGGMAGMDF